MIPKFKKALLITTVLTVLAGCTHKDKYPGFIHWVLVGNVRGLDPAFTSDNYSSKVVAQIDEPLFQYSYLERPLKVEPLLADGMPQVSKDGLTYTIKIKKGVRFQDDPAFKDSKGRKLTTDDFVFAWNRLLDPKTKSEMAWTFQGRVKSFIAFDPNTLKIVLKKPYPQLVYILTLPATAPVPHEALEHYGNEFLNHPVGTGPYKLKTWVRGSEIVLEKNTNFRREVYTDSGEALPLNNGIVFYEMVEDQPRWLNFLKGKIDVLRIPKDNFDKAVQNGELTDEFQKQGFKLTKWEEPDIVYAAFNMADPLLGKNKYLRQALSLAFDNKTYMHIFHNDRGLLAQGPIPPGIEGYDPGFKNPYQGPDLERAKGLLKKAGYPDGRGLSDLEFNIDSGSSNRQTAEFFQAQFARIGVKTKLIMSPWPEFNNRVKTKKAQIFTMAWTADYPDAENFLQLFYGPNSSPGSNNSNYNNSTYDKLYEKASVMRDSPERTALYGKMQKMIVDDAPWIFQVHRKAFWMQHQWLKNFKYNVMILNNLKYLKTDKKK